MRVITGSARGISLQAPPGLTRPTMDRVRAAIFSSLGDAVPGARVLDLFAGSGGLGIEALSRGAESAVFVDTDRASALCIRRNLSKARLEGIVQTMDALRFVELYAEEHAFDLIFADPPYAKVDGDRDWAAELVAGGHIASALAPAGTFILECARTAPPPEGGGLSLLHSKSYGETSVLYFVRGS